MRPVAALLVLIVISGPMGASQQAPALTPQAQRAVDEIAKLWKMFQDLSLAHRNVEARAAGEKLLAVQRSVSGDVSAEVADRLRDLAGIAEAVGEYAESRRWVEQRIQVLSRLYKDDWWQLADSRVIITFLDWMAKASSASRTQLFDAFQKRYKAEQLAEDGPSPEAVKLAEEALPVVVELLGRDHPYTASAKHALATALESIGEDARARTIFEEVLALRTARLGRIHPLTSNTLRALGNLRRKHGDFPGAFTLLEEALRIKVDLQGRANVDTIQCLNDLGELAHAMGDEDGAELLFTAALEALRETNRAESADASMVTASLGLVHLARADYARAEALFREAIELKRKAIGEDSHAMATGLNALAELYVVMGDDLRAVGLSEQTLAIMRKVVGPSHPDTAVAMLNLAAIYSRLGDSRAIPLLKEGADLAAAQLGTRHPFVAAALGRLSTLYLGDGQYEIAEKLETEALSIYQDAYGSEHHWTASSTFDLGYIHHIAGDLSRATARYQEALALRRKLLGENHPDTVEVLDILGRLYVEHGDAVRAEPLLDEALLKTARNLELASSLQSERQQLVMGRQLENQIAWYLALAARGQVPAARAWERVLPWKGMVLSRQRAARSVSGRPELQKTFQELQAVTSRLAAAAFSSPGPGDVAARQRQVAQLSEEKERLESALSRQSAEFRTATQAPDARAVRAAIPADTALVDFFEYLQITPGGKGKRRSDEVRLMAFVVPSTGEIQAIDLGPRAPIARALSLWQPVLESGGTADDAARRLRGLLWEPIERVLPRAAHIVISPDGFLGRVPLAALPGRAAGTYLIEDRAISIVPAPQLLTELASRASSGASGLLALGDVNYDAGDAPPASQATARGKRAVATGAKYDRLPGTRGEIRTIEKIYRARFGAASLQLLSGSAAMEAAFRAHAPGRRYLHLATHGFFAPENFKSAIDATEAGAESSAARETVTGFHPGLLSGLVLAGANKPGVDEDGILTSEEVATLDLSSVDLAVLSACETGLGQVAGGEGLLGLQRAFQTAGARTVVATMWKVDDEATRIVMERFYDNLWNKRMGKREALREAQLWMLRDGRKPPFYWAAFVLSGDWR